MIKKENDDKHRFGGGEEKCWNKERKVGASMIMYVRQSNGYLLDMTVIHVCNELVIFLNLRSPNPVIMFISIVFAVTEVKKFHFVSAQE